MRYSINGDHAYRVLRFSIAQELFCRVPEGKFFRLEIDTELGKALLRCLGKDDHDPATRPSRPSNYLDNRKARVLIFPYRDENAKLFPDTKEPVELLEADASSAGIFFNLPEIKKTKTK